MEKKWYESKVILANLIGALIPILATFSPPVASFLQENYAAAGMGWMLLNVASRMLSATSNEGKELRRAVVPNVLNTVNR